MPVTQIKNPKEVSPWGFETAIVCAYAALIGWGAGSAGIPIT